MDAYTTLAPPTAVDILEGIVAASRDACWCMEFGRPVDLTAPDAEVVRQVFENEPRWSLANPAMAQLYMLPAGERFVDRPVAEIFPRNPQNEAFVLNLLANGFEVDAAPALDTRYDGAPIEVENDVRAHVEGGRLIRMFGTVRDVGKHRRREARLMAELEEARAVLSALPLAVLRVDAGGRVLWASPPAARMLGASPGGEVVQGVLSRALGRTVGGAARDALEAAVLGGPPARRGAGDWDVRAQALPQGGAVVLLTASGERR